MSDYSTPLAREYLWKYAEANNLSEDDVNRQIRDLEYRFTLGDNRYFGFFEVLDLFVMLKYGAIDVIYRDYPLTVDNIFDEPRRWIRHDLQYEKQAFEKELLIRILEDCGYKQIVYEKGVRYGRADIFAIHHATKITIYGECRMCRISKVIETLEEPGTQLWHLSADLELSQLYIYRQGINWQSMYQQLKNAQMEKMRLEMAKVKYNFKGV